MSSKVRQFFVKYRTWIIATLIVIGVFLLGLQASAYLFDPRVTAFIEGLESKIILFKTLHPTLLAVARKAGPVIAAMAGGSAVLVGGWFALYRWLVDQRWRRVQYTYGLVEAFFAKETTKLALTMLDVTGEIELPGNEGGESRLVDISEKLLINSLLTLQQQQRFAEPEFSIRMIFDQFFTDLSTFEHHIEAKLVQLEDIEPYLKYWIGSINGYGPIYSIKLARQINSFLKAFQYTAVLDLSKRMKLEFKDTEVETSRIENAGDDAEPVEDYNGDIQKWKQELDPKTGAHKIVVEYQLHSKIAEYFSIVRIDSAHARNDARANVDYKSFLWNSDIRKSASILDFFEKETRPDLQKALRTLIIPSLREQRKAWISKQKLEEDEEEEEGGEEEEEESLEQHVVALLKDLRSGLREGEGEPDEGEVTNDEKEKSDETRYWGIKQQAFSVGAVTLARSTADGKSSGLIFHYPPGSFAPKEHKYEVFVPWKELELYLSQKGARVFDGERPKDTPT